MLAITFSQTWWIWLILTLVMFGFVVIRVLRFFENNKSENMHLEVSESAESFFEHVKALLLCLFLMALFLTLTIKAH